MSRAKVEFELEDSEGKPHKYSIIPHKGTEGLSIVWRICQAAAAPVGRLLDSNTKILVEALINLAGGQDVDLESLLKGAEADFASSFDDFFKVLFVAGEERLTRDLLAHTYRDGKQLNKASEFDVAYQGNWGELMNALWKSVQVNNFLAPFRSLLGNYVTVKQRADVEDTTKSPEPQNELESTG